MQYPFYLLRKDGTKVYCLTRQKLEDNYLKDDKIFALDNNTGVFIEADSIDMAVGIVLA